MHAKARHLPEPKAPPAGAAMNALFTDFSIEITAKDVEELEALAALVPPGTMVSVTFLPRESFESRIDAAARLQALGLRPVPHISARRLANARELESFIDGLARRIALEQVFVVAGDLPLASGPYADALAVIRSGLLERYGVKHVGVAGYPEGHPQITRQQLAQALRDKSAALAERGLECSIMTQFGFDAYPVFTWLAAIRREGIDVPVRIGIAGPAKLRTLMRFAARCGVGTSAKVMKKYGWSVSGLLDRAGPRTILEQLGAGLDPAVHGATKLHFYPFGGLVTTANWIADFTGTRSAVDS
jgi:methylenetetrahydrofolate reductase (NADPH)